jgi:hypothetical protein
MSARIGAGSRNPAEMFSGTLGVRVPKVEEHWARGLGCSATCLDVVQDRTSLSCGRLCGLGENRNSDSGTLRTALASGL